MYSFYPGPSQLYPQVRDYLSEAYDSGILSVNHRSPAFIDLAQQTVALLKEKLAIPSDYSVYFISSATECWEIIAQSFAGSLGSTHFYNGAFGHKWADHTQQITGTAAYWPFDLESNLPIGADDSPTLLCLTHNETANGTRLTPSDLQAVRAAWPQALVALDATSSMGGVELPWELIDLAFASVQKCFGLPAGLAILVTSPRGVQAALAINERRHYNSLVSIHQHALTGQTTHTPNVMAIYLLMRVLAQRQAIAQVAAQTRERAADWYTFLADRNFDLLVKTPDRRSETVVAVQGSPGWIARTKATAQAAGFLLGNGYGQWKTQTFRLANFPAIEQPPIDALKELLDKFGSE